MTVETEEELERLREAGRLVANILQKMGASIEEGMTTAELDTIGGKMMDAVGARPAPLITYGFPGATCISVNEEAAHGVPGARVLQRGDLVHIDVSAELDGYFSDTGACFAVGEPSALQQRLMEATETTCLRGIHVARPGTALRNIGRTMERVARRAGFSVMRDLGSHGIGRALHEDPDHIPGFDDPTCAGRLWEGAVITIEPFLTTGSMYTRDSDDGWTLLNDPGSFTAQMEHTIVVTRHGPMLMTLPDCA